MKKPAIAVFLLIAIAMAATASAIAWTKPQSSNDAAFSKTHDDILKDIADTVPGFGGVFMSEDGTSLNIYLTGSNHTPTKQNEAREAVEDKFGPRNGTTLTILKAKYSMTQLHSWLNTMRDDIANHEATVTYGIAEDKNRLNVEIDNLEKQSEIEGILTSHGIPLGAVLIE